MALWVHGLLMQISINYSLYQGGIQRFLKEGVLYVGHHSLPVKKILGFRWSKKAEIMLETGKLFLSVFSNFLIKIFVKSLINFLKFTNALIRKEKTNTHTAVNEKRKIEKNWALFHNRLFYKALKGATKLYFMHHLRVVSILFSTGLFKFAFSTYLLVTLGFRLSCFCIFGFNFYFCSMF